MKDTYFVPAFGNRPRNLVGREEILQIFQDNLQSLPGSRERSTLILGQRGSADQRGCSRDLRLTLSYAINRALHCPSCG